MANSMKPVCDIENSRQGRNLHISVNDVVIFPIREDFILRIYEVL